MITARCEILLSPGTVISRSSRGARLIRNSIDEVLKFFAKRTRYPRAREEHHRIEGAVVQPCSPETNLRFVRSTFPRRTSVAKITERERFCPYRDPLLPFLEESLPHRRTCQANTDFPRDGVCQGREFRRDNLPSRPSSAPPWEEVKLQSPPVAYRWAGRVHWD